MSREKMLTMFVRSVALCAMVFAFLAAPSAAATTPADTIEVTTKFSLGRDGIPSIDFSVTNRSTSTLMFDINDLPWGHSRSVVLLVVPPYSRRSALSQRVPLHNPIFEEIALRPRETLSGSVGLGLTRDQLRELVAQGPVLVLWSYALRLSDGTTLPRQTGHVEIRKGQI